MTVETDGRKRRGQRTRESILRTAADLASVEGLEGLTIGRLADALRMSKSGLFAHFGSKEELQLATIETASARFVEHVVMPTRDLPPGRARLDALMRAKLAYFRGDVFPGGCFFESVRQEFDSRPESPVRDAIVEEEAKWEAFLQREIRRAQEVGDLDPSVDPEQLAFELDALTSTANARHQLRRDPAVFDRAATAIAARLDALAPAERA